LQKKVTQNKNIEKILKKVFKNEKLSVIIIMFDFWIY